MFAKNVRAFAQAESADMAADSDVQYQENQDKLSYASSF
jgi:hypothetical protein